MWVPPQRSLTEPQALPAQAWAFVRGVQQALLKQTSPLLQQSPSQQSVAQSGLACPLTLFVCSHLFWPSQTLSRHVWVGQASQMTERPQLSVTGPQRSWQVCCLVGGRSNSPDGRPGRRRSRFRGSIA